MSKFFENCLIELDTVLKILSLIYRLFKRNFETKLTAAKEAPRAETEMLKSEMDQLQKDLKNFADREDSLTKQVNELKTEKEEAKNQENEHMQSLEEEISILSQQEEQYQGNITE